MTRDDQYLSSGAYALNAMSPEEARAFEEAMASSPDLAQEGDELVATATLLALSSVPVQPPSSLKALLMAKIAETAQDAPASPRASTPLDTPAGSSNDGTPSVVTTLPAPIADVAAPVALSASTPAADKAHSRWFTRPMGVLVAAAAAVALFVGGGVIGNTINQTGPSTSQDASASSLAQIFASPDVQSSHNAITGGGEATVVWSGKLGRSAIVATGLASLPSDKTYEAWYVNGSTVTPAGTFTPGGDTTTWHVLSGSLTAGDGVAVTVEPSGGSQSPTSDPILSVQSA